MRQCEKPKSKKQNHREGFTLVEMIISIFVFGIAVTFLVLTYITAQDAEQATIGYINTVDNLRVALENMARDIRTGLNFDENHDTTDQNPLRSNFLSFNDRLGREVTFCIAQCQFPTPQGTFKQCIKKSINAACNNASPDLITAADIDIRELTFLVRSTSCANPQDTEAPRVTSKIRAAIPFKDETIDFQIQTTISPRVFPKTCF